MQKKKSIQPPATAPDDPETKDPFFRRIEVQNTIIKKILSEIENTAKPESQPEVGDKIADLNIPEKGNDEQAW
jgi:hypothetical protein